jgi:hypothetical protein
MEKIGEILGIVFVGLAIIFVLAFPVQWLWNNCLVPAVNGINAHWVLASIRSYNSRKCII